MFVAVSSIEVPEEHADALVERFRDRARRVDEHDGFRRLRLAKHKGRPEFWLILEWEDQADFKAYVQHPDFEHAHGSLDEQLEAGPLRQLEIVLDSDRGE